MLSSFLASVALGPFCLAVVFVALGHLTIGGGVCSHRAFHRAKPTMAPPKQKRVDQELFIPYGDNDDYAWARNMRVYDPRLPKVQRFPGGYTTISTNVIAVSSVFSLVVLSPFVSFPRRLARCDLCQELMRANKLENCVNCIKHGCFLLSDGRRNTRSHRVRL